MISFPLFCHDSGMINVRINIYDPAQIINNSLGPNKLVDRLSPCELSQANQKNSMKIPLTVHKYFIHYVFTTTRTYYGNFVFTSMFPLNVHFYLWFIINAWLNWFDRKEISSDNRQNHNRNACREVL